MRLAHWLLDILIDQDIADIQPAENPLVRIAGRFPGGPGDTAEKAEKNPDRRSGCGLWIGYPMSQLLDTGFLYALLNRHESLHQDVLNIDFVDTVIVAVAERLDIT